MTIGARRSIACQEIAGPIGTVVPTMSSPFATRTMSVSFVASNTMSEAEL
ncbi:MAG TPA: hypothetical protein VM070_03615 [Candidatus Saccharimonadales bacterium]|nr:hypothetical protein [Candidatus Saccharimonadales bacterium]